jgi:hypothetical protein
MYFEVQTGEAGCDVRVSDILWIHTRHSLYEFFVIDPVKAYGVVKGGVLGAVAKEGFLCLPLSLAAGSRAELLIESSKGATRYLTTSPITSVRHFRSS